MNLVGSLRYARSTGRPHPRRRSACPGVGRRVPPQQLPPAVGTMNRRPTMPPPHDCSCRRFPRRAFLADLGMGFTGLALAAMLQRDGYASAPAAVDSAEPWSPPDGKPHFAPKAKRVIWLF